MRLRKFAIFTLNRHLYEQEDEAEEGQTMTMKEIEEQKRKEKELQQKKVQFNSCARPSLC